MTKTNKRKAGKKRGRVQVKDLKKSGRELTKEERRRIRGGVYGSANHPHTWTQEEHLSAEGGQATSD